MTARLGATLCLSLLVVAAAGTASLAQDARAVDPQRCFANIGLNERIAACTAFITAGQGGNAALARAHNSRGSALLARNDTDRALVDFEHAVRLNPNYANAVANRGRAWQAKNDLDRAIADYTTAIRLDPKDDAGAYRVRSTVWRLKGDFNRAISDANEAIELYPDYAAAYVERGLAYEQRGDLGRARADYEAALAATTQWVSTPVAHETARRRLQELAATPPPAAPSAAASQAAAPASDFKRRVALVVGNGEYQFANKLPNPSNDAADLAGALRRLGFEVVEGRNLDRRGMDNVIREFGRKLDRADLALFFYAGHGLQVAGKNYLVPVDARLERAADLALDAVEINVVLAQMEAESRVNLIFLDACRDNPLTRSLARALGTRSAAVGQGLAPIQSAIGTMIAYSTQPDNVALDGDGRNSPFTTALLKHIGVRGLDISTVMRRVRADVIDSTRQKQVPWDHSSLVGDVVLAR